MYQLNLIKPEENIGDSLNTINLNYANLDLWTKTLQTSATNYWKPLSELFLNKSSKWLETINLVQSNSARWLSATDSVEKNTFKWLEPLTLFYPAVLNTNTASASSTIQVTISAWLNNNFPAYSPTKEVSNYIERQEAIVYTLSSFTMTPETNSLFSEGRHNEGVIYTLALPTTSTKLKTYVMRTSALCDIVDSSVYGECTGKWDGIVYCNKNARDCSDTDSGTAKVVVDSKNKTRDVAADKAVKLFKPSTQTLSFTTYGDVDLSCYYSYSRGYLPPSESNLVEPDGTLNESRFKQLDSVNKNYAAMKVVSPLTLTTQLDFKDTQEISAYVAYRFVVQNCQWVAITSEIARKLNFTNKSENLPIPSEDINAAPIYLNQGIVKPSFPPGSVAIPNPSYYNLGFYLKAGEKLTWIVPDGVTKIRISANGPAGPGGDSSAGQDSTFGIVNKGGRVIQKYYQARNFSEHNIISLTDFYKEYNYPLIFTTGENGTIAGNGRGGGNGTSGGGGAGGPLSNGGRYWINGAGGGGAGAWVRKTLNVQPGQIFTYTAAMPGLDTTISSGNWYMTAGAGKPGENSFNVPQGSRVVQGGNPGSPAGSYDLNLETDAGGSTKNLYGGMGAVNRVYTGSYMGDQFLNLGGYIYIQILP